MRPVRLLDRLVERRYCLCQEGCPRFNWKEEALAPWIIVILEVTFAFEFDLYFSVNRRELYTRR